MKLKINVRRCVVHIRKSHICANFVDMQKTNSRFAQQHRDRNLSLDAGVRMKGIPALGLWDTVNDVLEPIARGDFMRKQKQKHNAEQGKVNWRAGDFDHVLLFAHMSSWWASLFLFEDTKAVIKMISKSRSSDMRHVSRTHRVDLDRLF